MVSSAQILFLLEGDGALNGTSIWIHNTGLSVGGSKEVEIMQEHWICNIVLV